MLPPLPEPGSLPDAAKSYSMTNELLPPVMSMLLPPALAVLPVYSMTNCLLPPSTVIAESPGMMVVTWPYWAGAPVWATLP